MRRSCESQSSTGSGPLWVSLVNRTRAAGRCQAHRARLKTGEPVIVKVQRPGIAEAVERDLMVLLQLASTVEERTSWGAEYRVTEMVAEFADRLREELDFQIEARSALAIARNMAGMPEVHIPVPTRETCWCSRTGRLGSSTSARPADWIPCSCPPCAR